MERIKFESVIKIDIKETYRIIERHLRDNAAYSFKLINEADIDPLVEALLSYLFKSISYFHVIGNGRCGLIFTFYEYEDFIELFDEMFIEVTEFFNLKGLTRQYCYIIIILNRRTIVAYECGNKDEIKNLYARHLLPY